MPKDLSSFDGTGFAPFASIIRDEEVCGDFEQVIVTQTCRELRIFNMLSIELRRLKNAHL